MNKLKASPMPQCGIKLVNVLIQGTISEEVQGEHSYCMAGLPNSGYLVSTKGIQMSRKYTMSKHCGSHDEANVDAMRIVPK
jgi:hypothetical protein